MTNNNKLRWGIIGAARINQQLMPAIVAANNSELVAIASRRAGAAEEALQQYAPKVGNVRIYNDLENLLQDEEVQAVYIPLATEEHAQWTLNAIEHGKHVLCEKPMALGVADINIIAKAAEKNRVYVMEGFMYCFHPQHQRIQKIIDSGSIGEVRLVRTCFAYPMQPARQYRVNRPICEGGGGMWDIGCYAIHAARFHFGNTPAQAVNAMAKHNKYGADISCSGSIDFGDGKYAQFSFSYEHMRRAEYEVIGTKGSIKCHNVWAKKDEQPVISWQTEAGDEHVEHLELANHFQLEVEHFCSGVLHNRPLKLSLQDAKSNCQIIMAALQSVAEERTIPF